MAPREKKRPGRPTSASAAQRPGMREQILSSATQLFAERGFEGVSLQEVANETGVNTALVAYYFGGKGGLKKAVIDRCNTDLSAHIAKQVQLLWSGTTIDSPPPTPAQLAERFSELLSAAFEFARKSETNYRIQAWQVAERGTSLRDSIENAVSTLVSAHVEMLRASLPQIPEAELEARAALMGLLMDLYGRFYWFFAKDTKLSSPRARFLAEFEKVLRGDLVKALVSPALPRV